MPYSENHWCKRFHTMVVCVVLHLSMSCEKSRESAHVRQKYTMWKKKCVFWKCLDICQLSLFRPIVANYIMDIHILMVMCIPNPVYNSLDVRYTVFFCNCKFRERDDVGHAAALALGAGCNTYSGGDSMCFGVNRAHCDTITKTWHVTIL